MFTSMTDKQLDNKHLVYNIEMFVPVTIIDFEAIESYKITPDNAVVVLSREDKVTHINYIMDYYGVTDKSKRNGFYTLLSNLNLSILAMRFLSLIHINKDFDLIN